MSRCFPFPPPGYTLGSARKEIEIEIDLIKLHEIRQQKKEKRREKKERKKERRERRKERRERRKNKEYKQCPNSDKSDIVKGQIGQQVCSDYKEELLQKKNEAKIVKFERSSLTEEHGRPTSLQVPSSSCDSTENTSNTKKRASPEGDSYGLSEAILIRSPASTESDIQAQHQLSSLRKRQEICGIEGISLRNNGEEICSISGQIEAGKTIRPMSDDAVNPMQGVGSPYKDLLENWHPPGLQDTSFYAVDLEWLFHDRRRNREERDEKRRKCGSGNISSCKSGGWWPRAEYLSEVSVFALPYAIPY